ncbi:MAG TPA: winged helix-turn-helix transcriptional regulator [Xanthobacteraceae bacterium]|nr:winged helix-turn-helix transcriptional regulator [Xanthobacteraceae bacterium]
MQTPAGRDAADDEIVLGVLDAVERDPSVTQRSVARELGIALGLANAYLRRCVRKGLIKVSQVPRRRYAYYLTPQGFAEKSRLTATYLSDSFSFFRKARTQCGDLFSLAAARGQRRLALLGHGDLAEIASLVAREHPIEIVGVIAAGESGQPVADLAAIDRVDAIMVTALVDPRGALEAALRAFGSDRVYVPAILRVRMPAPAAARPGEAA